MGTAVQPFSRRAQVSSDMAALSAPQLSCQVHLILAIARAMSTRDAASSELINGHNRQQHYSGKTPRVSSSCSNDQKLIALSHYLTFRINHFLP